MKKPLYFILIILLISCNIKNNEKTSVRNVHEDEYYEIFSAAMTSTNTDEIESAIEYLNKRIEKDGEDKIMSIYYDKARLQYRLNNYNEAIKTLEMSNFEINEIYKAALLILMGNDLEAQLLLDNFFIDYMDSISKYEITSGMINTLLVICILMDKNIDDVLNEFEIKYNHLDIMDYNGLFENPMLNITKTELLKMIWRD